ncbi:hypothetical protein THII_2644 [Thioploca ingrica]|uniref:Uncharacterized protein n=1 Tax=Thioploca ingrica TaxID=40754 RepID=A0A090BVJ0_9GAMM|nr:hypothetical protein THII_2644 [Thioploca ingrica]
MHRTPIIHLYHGSIVGWATLRFCPPNPLNINLLKIEFNFDGIYQVVEKIPLSGKCYWWLDETAATAATD